MAQDPLACSDPGIISRTLARITVRAFDAAVRHGFRLQVRGSGNVPGSGAVLAVANHRRDSDGPILGHVLWNGTGRDLPRFVAREDLFRAGFLRDYCERPSLAREVLGPINVGPMLWAVGARPMRRIPERSLDEVLADVLEQLGDRPLEGVLRDRWTQAFGAPGKVLTVRQALSRRYRWLLREPRGLYKLTLSCFRELKAHHRVVIERQLQHLTELLDQDSVLVLEPEGRVSESGECARPRAALHALINRPRRAPHVLPVGLTYDFMSPGRSTVFVNIGKPCVDLRGRSRKETDERVAEAMRMQSTVTASQLVSRMIYSRRATDKSITQEMIMEFAAAEGVRCAERGIFVDPRLLDPTSLQHRIAACIRWCVRMGVLHRTPRDRYEIVGGQRPAPGCWSNAPNVIDYLNNELDAFWPVPAPSVAAGRS